MAEPQVIGGMEIFRQKPIDEKLAAVLAMKEKADQLSLLIDGFTIEELSHLGERTPSRKTDLICEERQLEDLLSLVRLALLRKIAGRALRRKVGPEEVEQRLKVDQQRLRMG